MLIALYMLNLCLCQLSKFFVIFTLPFERDCQQCSSILYCLYIVSHFTIILCGYILINYRLWYEGALKYLGESVTGLKFRIWN